MLKFMDGVIEIDVVSLEEGVNLHPGSEAQHTPHLSFRQALAAVSLQRQGFKSGAREVWLLVLDHACDIVRDLELHVHAAQVSHFPRVIHQGGKRQPSRKTRVESAAIGKDAICSTLGEQIAWGQPELRFKNSCA